MMEFFPPGALADQPELHTFRARWYAPHLLSMQERPLYPLGADEPEVYRLLFLPTFHEPVVVRLSEVEGAWRAVCKRSDGRGGYGPGRLTTETERDLSAAQANQFRRLLDRAGFWEMPSWEDSAGLDGSQAVLEGVRPGRYHVVDRWSPHGTPYARLVEFLLKLARG
jgi:hypothetical protein